MKRAIYAGDLHDAELLLGKMDHHLRHLGHSCSSYLRRRGSSNPHVKEAAEMFLQRIEEQLAEIKELRGCGFNPGVDIMPCGPVRPIRIVDVVDEGEQPRGLLARLRAAWRLLW